VDGWPAAKRTGTEPRRAAVAHCVDAEACCQCWGRQNAPGQSGPALAQAAAQTRTESQSLPRPASTERPGCRIVLGRQYRFHIHPREMTLHGRPRPRQFCRTSSDPRLVHEWNPRRMEHCLSRVIRRYMETPLCWLFVAIGADGNRCRCQDFSRIVTRAIPARRPIGSRRVPRSSGGSRVSSKTRRLRRP
jgi:hypothetical protein